MKKTLLLFLTTATVTALVAPLAAQNNSTGYRPLRPEMEDFVEYQQQLRKEGGRRTQTSVASSSVYRHQSQSTDSSSYAQTDFSYPNAFISVAPSVLIVTRKHSENMTMAGAAVEGGVYFTENLRLSLGVGYYYWDKTHQMYYVSVKEKQDCLPILLNFNYAFNLPHDLQFRIGPTIGATFARIQLGASGGSISHSEWTFTYGANVGLTWQCSENFNIGFDYRFCARSDSSANMSGISFEAKSVRAHQFALSAGWRW